MGPFPTERLGEVLRSMDLLAVPALWFENDPITVKAALYLRVPVLASRIGSLPGMLGRNASRWLVEPGQPGRWAEALGKLVRGPMPPVPPPFGGTMDETAQRVMMIYEQETKRTRS